MSGCLLVLLIFCTGGILDAIGTECAEYIT